RLRLRKAAPPMRKLQTPARRQRPPLTRRDLLTGTDMAKEVGEVLNWLLTVGCCTTGSTANGSSQPAPFPQRRRFRLWSGFGSRKMEEYRTSKSLGRRVT